jgi:hypothetical protein
MVLRYGRVNAKRLFHHSIEQWELPIQVVERRVSCHGNFVSQILLEARIDAQFV